MPYLSANTISSPFKIHQNLKHFSLTSGFYSDPRDCHHLLPTFCFLSSCLFSLHPTQQLDQSDHMTAQLTTLQRLPHLTSPSPNNRIPYTTFHSAAVRGASFPSVEHTRHVPTSVSYHSFSQEHSSHTGLFPNLLQAILRCHLYNEGSPV